MLKYDPTTAINGLPKNANTQEVFSTAQEFEKAIEKWEQDGFKVAKSSILLPVSESIIYIIPVRGEAGTASSDEKRKLAFVAGYVCDANGTYVSHSDGQTVVAHPKQAGIRFGQLANEAAKCLLHIGKPIPVKVIQRGDYKNIAVQFSMIGKAPQSQAVSWLDNLTAPQKATYDVVKDLGLSEADLKAKVLAS